jgi:transposase
MKKWIVRLESEERDQLERVVRVGTASAYRIRHANVLLAVDESPRGARFRDTDAARAFGVSVRSIESLRQRYVEEGLEAALGRKKQERPSVAPMFDGTKEAKLVAIACGKAPSGRSGWTLKLLAERVVELKIVERCSADTVRKVLQKTR